MSVTLAASCCCGKGGGGNPCESNFDFFDCATGSRLFAPPGGGASYMTPTLGVSMSSLHTPAGPGIFSASLFQSLPGVQSAIGGIVNNAEPGDGNFDFIGAKVGNWNPFGSGAVREREELLIAYGEQFPSSFVPPTCLVYSFSESADDILKGNAEQILPPSIGLPLPLDRLRLTILGPEQCKGQGCDLVSTMEIELSATNFPRPKLYYKVGFYRGTQRDGGLGADCVPTGASGLCEQIPQDLSPVIMEHSRPAHYVFGNECGVPQATQEEIKKKDPTAFDNWYPMGDLCVGSDYYWGECADGWHRDGCEDTTDKIYGTRPSVSAACSCCDYDFDSRELSPMVIT